MSARTAGTATPSKGPADPGFDTRALSRFETDGFLVARGLAPAPWVRAMRQVTDRDLASRRPPLELEAQLRYPGAPTSEAAPGGDAVRRLRQAYDRHGIFRDWVHHPPLARRLAQLLGGDVCMPLAHHNCIMTKQPAYSSDSLWHQDLRYWSYTRGELITAWLALGRERPENGGLQVIPGSHRLALHPGRFDAARFFRHDREDNRRLIDTATPVELEAGDVLFFHCRLLHAATRNHEQTPKLAAVFTFRRHDDEPLPGSRSAAGGDVTIAAQG